MLYFSKFIDKLYNIFYYELFMIYESNDGVLNRQICPVVKY